MNGSITQIRVVPVAEVPWSDVQAVFGTRGDPAGCWCQWFKQSTAEWREQDATCREAALREQSRDGSGPGLIAYLNGEPVGWVAVEPRQAYPRLRTARVVTKGSSEPFDDPAV